MLGFLEDLKTTFSGSSSSKLVKTIFKRTLEQDKKKRAKYRGYPSPITKFFADLTKKTGIKFVDISKRDFTLYPLINQFKGYLGGEKSIIFKALTNLNRKLFGGITDMKRFNTQILFLESYRDYAQNFDPTVTLDNIMAKKIPYYLLRILEQFRVGADKDGVSLKRFILNNSNYFKEIAVFFDFKDKSDFQCLDQALEELIARKEATKRKYTVRTSLVSATIDIMFLTFSFGLYVIPEIITSFEASIDDFSAPVRFIEKFSRFIVNRWYLVILIVIGVRQLFKRDAVKLVIGYIMVRIPFVRNYVVNDQLLRFLKSYMNLIQTKGLRESYTDSLKMFDNEFIRFIFESYIEGLGGVGISFYVVMESIPYIPKEYVDILKETEELGKPEDGINKVIGIIEPKMEDIMKKFTKQLIITVLVTSATLILFVSYFLFNDMTRVIDTYNQEFVNRLRN